MASVRDLSGNTPEADSDQALAGSYDLQAVDYKGTQHNITLGSSSVQTAKFSRQCRSIRLAPLGDCHHEIGTNPVATTASPFLADNGVEYIPVAFNERLAIIQSGAATDIVTITEDKS